MHRIIYFVYDMLRYASEYVPKRKFKNRERLGLDIFQNGGLVENLKFGRKSKVWAKNIVRFSHN